MKRLRLKRYDRVAPDGIRCPPMPSRMRPELARMKQEEHVAATFFSQRMEHEELRGRVLRPADAFEALEA